MYSWLYALITVFGWGTWLAPSQRASSPISNQESVCAGPITSIATVWRCYRAAREHGGAMFWLTFAGADRALAASRLTGTAKLGMAKAFASGHPSYCGQPDLGRSVIR
jgi:hypothetical protein